MDKTSTELFLDLYKQLERAIKSRFGLEQHEAPIPWLVRNNTAFASMRDELECCRQVRNLLTHNEKINGEYAVAPSQAMIDVLRKAVEKVDNPKRITQVGCGAEKVFGVSMDDAVRPALMKMVECSYSHVPILDDGHVIGVFSENDLVKHLINNEIVEISGEMRFKELEALLPVEAHNVGTYAFVAKDALAVEVADLFKAALAKGERLEMVFYTAHGQKAERILGLVTAWDMVAYF